MAELRTNGCGSKLVFPVVSVSAKKYSDLCRSFFHVGRGEVGVVWCCDGSVVVGRVEHWGAVAARKNSQKNGRFVAGNRVGDCNRGRRTGWIRSGCGGQRTEYLQDSLLVSRTLLARGLCLYRCPTYHALLRRR